MVFLCRKRFGCERVTRIEEEGMGVGGVEVGRGSRSGFVACSGVIAPRCVSNGEGLCLHLKSGYVVEVRRRTMVMNIL